MSKRHFIKIFIYITAITILTNGCAFIKLQKNIDELNKLGTLSGAINAATATEAPIILALLKLTPTHLQLENYQVQQRPGPFTMLVNPGNYRLFAFEDLNHDKKYQVNERIVKSRLLTVTPGEKIADIVLLIPATPDHELAVVIDKMRQNIEKNLTIKANLGKIVTLNEKYFSPGNSSMGMWEPMRFVKEVPFGLFLLQPYDPNKIPILFVHGINGSPRNFRYIVKKLDKTKYQPWIFYYPTGLRLNLTSNFLNNSVIELLVKYKIRKIYVVAHSMGGLVSRAFINKNLTNNKNSEIKLFISISSPWQGHKMAKFGVEKAPVVMPVWNDMSPDSKFLKELYVKKLPAGLPYYLLFSYKGGSNSGGETNDEAVTIASQLRPEAQQTAKLVRGFNHTHTSILKSEQVAKLINQILDKHH